MTSTAVTTATVAARGVCVHFEGVHAVDGVDLDLPQGEILGLIGPNGAGKTTLVNALSGFQRPTAGEIRMGGDRVDRWSPARLARHGIARTFQHGRLFEGLTVLENVTVGALGVGVSPREARRRAATLLERFGLSPRAAMPAAALATGEERLVGIARALATAPRFVLLDEPAAGLNEAEGDALVIALEAVRDETGCGLLVIEHDMRLIMRLCQRIQVLDYGRTIAIGTPAEVQADEAVLAAYLGTASSEIVEELLGPHEEGADDAGPT